MFEEKIDLFDLYKDRGGKDDKETFEKNIKVFAALCADKSMNRHPLKKRMTIMACMADHNVTSTETELYFSAIDERNT